MHHLLGTLVALLVATKLLGALAQRFGQPAVLGELVAGVLLGGSLLGVLDPTEPVLHALSELGVLVLLFEIGLETDLRALVRVGGAATTVALVGVALPCALGYAASIALGLSPIAATVAAASLSATSIGISARVLSDLGQLETPEGQIVLGAAVLDDVVGLVILAVVGAAAAGVGVGVGMVARTALVAAGFIAGALVLGRLVVPPLFGLLARVRAPGTLVALGLALAFAMAWLAEGAGSATIIGAFAAGLVLHETPQREEVEHAVTTVGHLIVPVFFAAVGASVDVRTLADPRTLAVGAALVATGVAGKFAAGYAPVWFRGRKALIGAAMIPRGEVGLIFAQAGLASRVLSPALFSAVAMMVLATTFLAPPLLARIVETAGPPNDEARPGDGGVDDLVFGEEGATD